MMDKHIYIAIDLKSFYASVECVDRGLDPLTTNLVVADRSRSEKTICLAVSPSLKQYGIGGRARLFEVEQKVKEINNQRLKNTRSYQFTGKSFYDQELKEDPNLELDFIAAPPRMAHYIEISTKIHEIYLKYISPDDIHVYSIDEVFMDVTSYLNTYSTTPKELAMMIIHDILATTGITATAGIGTNLFLCKVAMDIVAKHMQPDENGVRIAQLNEKMYRKYLWNHKPITDFWRVGKGYAKRLEKLGLYTMGDIANCSIGSEKEYYNEDLLYKEFGINAELLIDHAWGVEPCTIKDIKAYKPERNSLGTGQVLSRPYTYDEAKTILKEMLDGLALSLVEKEMVTNQLVITIGYDIDNKDYEGEITTDWYGRNIPKHAHWTVNLDRYSSSGTLFIQEALKGYKVKVNKKLNIRRLNISATDIIDEAKVINKEYHQQLDLFSYTNVKENKKEKEALEKENRLQKATLEIKNKYGKNAIIKGLDLEEEATTIQRNESIGGHKA